MLRRDGDEMTAVLRLAPGSYDYKFIVDNQWRSTTPNKHKTTGYDEMFLHARRYDGNQPVVKGRNGNINNVIHVEAPPEQSKEVADPESPGKTREPHLPIAHWEVFFCSRGRDHTVWNND